MKPFKSSNATYLVSSPGLRKYTTVEVYKKIKYPSYGLENILSRTSIIGYGRRHENRYIKSKPALSEQVLEKLRDSLSDEYEIYYFCQQRLYNQYQQTINIH